MQINAETNTDPTFSLTAEAKLTALWALSEGGLGGILHAARLPLKGVILACTATVAICLITRVTGKRTAALRAALLVIAVKAVLAPHSPATAHLAVLNQALIGTLCMTILGPSLIGCVLTGALCLTETSLHQLLWATLLGGTDLWTALDDLLIRGQRWTFGRVLVTEPARWMVFLYAGLHVTMGVLAGAVAWLLPRLANRILARHKALAASSPATVDSASSQQGPKRSRRGRMLRAGIFIVAVIFLAGPGLALSGHGPWHWRLLWATARVIAVISLIVFVMRPLAARLTNWLLRRGRGQSQFAGTLASVRSLQEEARGTWQESTALAIWRRIPHTVAVLFATALTPCGNGQPQPRA
ncbi:MAG: hypothetical protein JXQ73_23720 [Phycisphaerae bacterium]|nr:hypothetical protein [Phycisphaerae bacterium]